MQSLTVTGVAIVVEFKTITAGAPNAVFILMAVVFTVVGGVVVTTPAACQVWTVENKRMSNRKCREWKDVKQETKRKETKRTDGCPTGNKENRGLSNETKTTET